MLRLGPMLSMSSLDELAFYSTISPVTLLTSIRAIGSEMEQHSSLEP